MKNLPDIQKETNGFPKISIEKVGVEGIKANMLIRSKNKHKQSVLANINSYCSLDSNTKGINMSRIGNSIFTVISENKNKGFSNFEEFAKKLKNAHQTDNVYIKGGFDYIIYNQTPITNIYSPKYVYVEMETTIECQSIKNFLTVKSTEMSLCPCSKEMSLLKYTLTNKELSMVNSLPQNLKNKILSSGFGAHSQKSEIQVKVELSKTNPLWIEDILEIITKSASAPTYSILKRPDEKWVTEVAYTGGYWEGSNFKEVDGGPKFVEDIARNIVDRLNKIMGKNIKDFIVKVNNKESIHSSEISAVSILTAGKDLKS